MTVELKIPVVGESISEVEIGEWFKAEGDAVNKDENVVSLESEKATVELPAPAAGIIARILKRKGEKAAVGETIGFIDPAALISDVEKPAPTAEPAEAKTEPARAAAEPAAHPEPAAAPVQAAEREPEPAQPEAAQPEPPRAVPARPARRERVMAKNRTIPTAQQKAITEEEEVVPMTPLRRTVAGHLVEALHTMAVLTTFNEIDMSEVVRLRKEHQEEFVARYGLKLGFMPFFVKAVIESLKQVRGLNASIRGDDIVYYKRYDLGVAVSTDKGLVVPVLKSADRMSFAEIERAIADFGARARDNKLKPDELRGGTFTISNGGVFGSLMSTPIINPPQSGILGMHAIKDRPVAVDNAVVIRPMMYVALSYDHRIVDGREAVLFLRRVKELVETPARMLLEA